MFLLSPANCGGARAAQVLSPRAEFPLAAQLRAGGAPIGELFAFVSGLYFRGKLTYARRFAVSPDPGHPLISSGVLVITPSAGLRLSETLVTVPALRGFARVDVHQDNAVYRKPLELSARALAAELGPQCQVVLLGSIASPKYVDVLLQIFGRQLSFPVEFIGRGDMSRGGLLLRSAAAGVELEYVPVEGLGRHGTRPPRLPPLAARA